MSDARLLRIVRGERVVRAECVPTLAMPVLRGRACNARALQVRSSLKESLEKSGAKVL